MDYKALKVIISGGGTGGHIFPAVSIANKLPIETAAPKVEICPRKVFTIVLLISLISPFKNVKFDDVIDVFSPTNEQIELDKNTTDYFTYKITDYYEKEFKMMLFNENLITEDVKVEICGSEIVKIKIYLN